MTSEHLMRLLVRMFEALHEHYLRSPTLRLILPREVVAIIEEIEAWHVHAQK